VPETPCLYQEGAKDEREASGNFLWLPAGNHTTRHPLQDLPAGSQA